MPKHQRRQRPFLFLWLFRSFYTFYLKLCGRVFVSNACAVSLRLVAACAASVRGSLSFLCWINNIACAIDSNGTAFVIGFEHSPVHTTYMCTILCSPASNNQPCSESHLCTSLHAHRHKVIVVYIGGSMCSCTRMAVTRTDQVIVSEQTPI